MPGIAEILRALGGSYRLFLGDISGLQSFDDSADGFFRSFLVIALVAPFYAVTIVVERGLVLASTSAVVEATSYYLIHAVAFVVEWFAFPILMVPLARWLGLTRRYTTFIVARNWTALPIVVASALPTAMFGLGWMEMTLTSVITTILLIVSLRYSWQIALAALQTTGSIAAALVALDFVISLFIRKISDGLIGL